MPTVSAPCTEAVRIVCRPRPHHARRPSASCADRVRIMHGVRPHNMPT
ncbi:MAG: hypothetical protein K2M96_00555 [Prevotella sp.]|nr:hypothetical protein [Prevotella sp.]MDE7455178.1 hypothetical protein [Prevotella sp.]